MKFLVAVDLSDLTEIVIEEAQKIAKPLNAKIWLVHIAQPDPEFVGWEAGPQSERDSVASKFHAEHVTLQKYAEELRTDGIDCVALLTQGETVKNILKEAKKLSVDMIIIGSHGKGATMRFLVGSTSEGVLHNSPIPMLIIPTHNRA
jgi:nucleotide-binding universal stress UspA family protein